MYIYKHMYVYIHTTYMCIHIYIHTHSYSHIFITGIFCECSFLVFVLGMWDSAVHKIDIALSLSLHFDAKYSHRRSKCINKYVISTCVKGYKGRGKISCESIIRNLLEIVWSGKVPLCR